MDRINFEDLRTKYQDQRVVMVGTGSSISRTRAVAGFGLPIFTVDTALQDLSEMGLQAQLLWVQDGRLLVDKQHQIAPYLSPDMTLCVPNSVNLPVFQRSPNIVEYNALGTMGFSHDPRLGAFSGHSAIYGLFQLMSWIRPKHIALTGVDIDFAATKSWEFPQINDPDFGLPSNDSHISHVLKGLSILRSQGIEVENYSDFALLDESDAGGGRYAKRVVSG